MSVNERIFREEIVAICELTKKRPAVVNLVSHSNIKTKSISMPNVQNKRLYSSILDQMVTLKIATSALRDMEHCGGFDNYILKQPSQLLSPRALSVKNRITKRVQGKLGKASKPKSISTSPSTKN